MIKFGNIFVFHFEIFKKSTIFDKNVYKVVKKRLMDQYSCWKDFFRENNGKPESIYCESLQNISSTALRHLRKQLSSALKYVIKCY